MKNCKSDLSKTVLKLSLVLLALGCSSEGVGISNSYGFGAAPAKPTDPVATNPVNPNPVNPVQPGDSSPGNPGNPVDVPGENVGTYEDGFELGLRNGGLIAERIENSTVGRDGCTSSAVKKMEKGLREVAKNVRLPEGESADVDYTKGFYKGYLKAVKNSLRHSRELCHLGKYSSGEFAGALYGGILCSVSVVDLQLLSTFETEPLWSEWAESDDVVSECVTSLTLTLQTCGSELENEIDVNLIDVLSKTSCANL